ncbi:hypothetical protein NQ314_007168 [Rhamnusium bicolor]|uniref:Uncharacterized protein n=1 Tax=Rhamnusium bicolor TaxID=1586634 RepID=A0AAV8YSZ5_9CUCU|nr:hypothetical protein NQ314_007168 [Rhamnusium bicolor]
MLQDNKALLSQVNCNYCPVPYYTYQPASVIETDNHILYWNRTIHTDRHIPNNRPDIMFTNRQTWQTYLIDITIPLPENIEKKYREKNLKVLTPGRRGKGYVATGRSEHNTNSDWGHRRDTSHTQACSSRFRNKRKRLYYDAKGSFD